MNSDENRSINKTEKALIEALSRLIKKEPTIPEFKQKIRKGKVIKILASTVEKEARLSNNALRHYKEIRDKIEAAEIQRKHCVSMVDVAVIKAHPLYKKAIEEQKKAKEECKKYQGEVLKLKREIDRKNAQLKENATQKDEIISALFIAIDSSKVREEAIKKVQNVVDFKLKARR